MRVSSRTRWAPITLVIGVAACTHGVPSSTLHPEEPLTLSAVTLPEGTALSEEALVAYLADVQVVYVGERHDAPVDHAVQARLVALLDPDVLGMEMFQRPFQAPLDAYGSGTLDEAGMLAETEWSERWGRPFEMYRGVVEAGRTGGARLLALNAPREWTRTIGRTGIESLAPEIRSALPEMPADEAHRAMVMEALSEHGGHGGESMDPAMLERFYTAQLVWDEVMGQTLAEALAGDDRAVVIAGRMHVQRGLGIPRTAMRRGVRSHRIVLPLTDEEIDAERENPVGLCDVAVRVSE
jgi:uncharacterized iron-regulated protein